MAKEDVKNTKENEHPMEPEVAELDDNNLEKVSGGSGSGDTGPDPTSLNVNCGC